MTNRIYVGNLAFSTDLDALQTTFSRIAPVDDVKIVTDRETGRSRGFAFVTMADADGAQRAIRELDGQMIDGRALRVNPAEPRQSGSSRGEPRRGW